LAVDGGEVVLEFGVPELVHRAGLAEDLTVERILAYPHEAHPPPPPKRKNNLGEPQQSRRSVL
jgi:hypothetical protein